MQVRPLPGSRAAAVLAQFEALLSNADIARSTSHDSEGHRQCFLNWFRDSRRTVLHLITMDSIETLLPMSIFYALVDDPEADAARPAQGRHLSYTSAGHLPAIMRFPDGTVTRLEQGRTTPVGIAGSRDVFQARTAFPDGSVLILYTDGLIERRGRDLEYGFSAIEDIRSLAAHVRDSPADL